jgi:mannosyltransferase
MGEEARSYAFTAAIAAWVTVLLLALAQGRFASSRAVRLGWLAYTVSIAIGTYLFLYFSLLLLVHGAFLLTSPAYRSSRRAWARASILALGVSLPILAIGFAQRQQIAFLAKRGYASLPAVLGTQWFGSNPLLAICAWVLIGIAGAGAVYSWRRRREVRPVVMLGMLWLAIPMLVLLATNAVTPAYNYRYLTFCVPGVALVITAGAWTIGHRAARIAALALVILLAVPTNVAERGPYAKDHGSDLRQSAEYIGLNAVAGDAVVFDETTWHRMRPRLGLHLYPGSFAEVQDVTLKRPYTASTGLWDETYSVADITPRLVPFDRVWLIEIHGSVDDVSGADLHTLESEGFAVTTRHVVKRTVIYLLERQS